MRRNRQLLSEADAVAVLLRGSNGVLACLGDEGYPYAVPLSYVYVDGRIYYHTAKAGHKVDAIAAHPKVSFAVVDQDRIVSAEYTTYFRSAIAFGTARIAQGEEMRKAYRALVEKYSADQPEEARQAEIDRCANADIVAIDVEHLTGKEAKELVQAKA